jgi:Tol biopolymer transport system component
MAQSLDASRLELVGEPVTVAEQLVGSYRDFGFFSASTNGFLVYRTGSSGGDSQLTWFDREGKALATPGERGGYLALALSPDGARAVASRLDRPNGNRALWLFDFSRGTSTRFTFSSSGADYPIWSADGNRIILMSNPSGVSDLYQKPSNGSKDEELLLKSSEDKFPSSLSRDGRFLLYYSSDPKTKYDLWVLPLEGDRKQFPFLRTEFNELDGHFSPDGNWVTYGSDESGHYEIYVRRFSPDPTAAASIQVESGRFLMARGSEPRWSADGKELYYLTPDWNVMAVAVTNNPVFQAGTPKLLFQVPPQPGVSVGDCTVDGKRFLFVAPAEQTGQAPFTVALNW